ncbi:hypothetical protein HMPREF1869_00172 [Bacteroidales bacterium KA00251]|nr:hypothetical protein HMPREF1869_00172 [Bacteroidales bacterium KA00251]
MKYKITISPVKKKNRKLMSKNIQSYHISLKKHPESGGATLDKAIPCRCDHAQRFSS